MPGAAVLNRGTFHDGRKPRLIRTKRKKEETVQQKIRILKRPGFRGIVSSFFSKIQRQIKTGWYILNNESALLFAGKAAYNKSSS